MSQTTLTIPGISCDHCKNTIEGALNGTEGVESATVSVPDKTVSISYDERTVGLDELKDVIVEQGYDLPA